MTNKRPKIGLVLGSGGTRGFAHIGVLKILHQNNIPIDFIAGTSVGALFGGAYAATKDIEKIEKAFLMHGWIKGAFKMLDPALSPHRGFLEGNGVEDFIYSLVKGKEFSDLKIPFSCVACDIATGKEIELSSGKITQAIRASLSIPIIFKPVHLDNHLLIDGDIVNPLPVNLAKKAGCDIIIAVSLTDKLVSQTSWRGVRKMRNVWEKIFGDRYFWKKQRFNLLSVMARRHTILRQKITQMYLEQADVKITPRISLKSATWIKIYNSRYNMKRLIKIGEEAAEKALPEIKKLISHNT